MANFTCPRRIEDGMHRDNSQFKHAGSNKDKWRDENTCTYCGSLNQDVFMQHLEAGSVTLTPTDKNYKVYVEGLPNPNVGKLKMRGSSSTPQSGKNWKKVTPLSRLTMPKLWSSVRNGDYVLIEPEKATIQHKFYFQHLSQEQRERFVQLLNEKKLRLDMPGYFYRLPFFCRPQD